MKKLFLVLAVASLGFVACNNEAETGISAEDSARIADSIKAAEDAMKMQPDTTSISVDTTAKADTLKK
jgi:hypothetical protein